MATVYWFGGTGNWSDQANHWSNNSGNTPASLHGSVPGTDDDVVFDTLSNSTDYTVTVDATANCQNFTMGAPLAGKVTWAGNSNLNIYGSLNLSGGTAGITISSGSITTFKSTGTVTINTNGVQLGGNQELVFNGIGGTFQLTSSLNLGKSSLFTLTNGTFDANSKDVILGSSTTGGTQLSLKGNTITFYNLIINGSSTASSPFLRLYTNCIIDNTLTINGYSSTYRVLVWTDTAGTPRTITAAATSISNADFQDITGAGAATWDLSAIAGGSGNCGGNSMKALGDAAFTTAATWYWHVDTGNVSDYTKWYTATNGGGSQMASTRVPLSQDTLIFDASSFDSGSKTVTQNMSRIGSIDFTGATNTPTFTTSTDASVFGSITLISGMTLTASTQTYTFGGRGSYTLDSGGKTWAKNITLNANTGSLQLKSALTLGATLYLTITSGTLTCVDGATNSVISTGLIYVESSASATLTLGSGTHLITGTTGTVWSFGASGVLSANTSTIKLTGALTANVTFAGGGKTTYNNFWNATTNAFNCIITGSNTFADFKIDAGRTVKFTNSTTTTVTTFTALGTAGSPITISNTSSTTKATLAKAGGGLISGCDYINASYLTGSPANTWYIGSNSTDAVGGSLTNIYLLNEPAPVTATAGFLYLMI